MNDTFFNLPVIYAGTIAVSIVTVLDGETFNECLGALLYRDNVQTVVGCNIRIANVAVQYGGILLWLINGEILIVTTNQRDGLVDKEGVESLVLKSNALCWIVGARSHQDGVALFKAVARQYIRNVLGWSLFPRAERIVLAVSSAYIPNSAAWVVKVRTGSEVGARHVNAGFAVSANAEDTPFVLCEFFQMVECELVRSCAIGEMIGCFAHLS